MPTICLPPWAGGVHALQTLIKFPWHGRVEASPTKPIVVRQIKHPRTSKQHHQNQPHSCSVPQKDRHIQRTPQGTDPRNVQGVPRICIRPWPGCIFQTLRTQFKFRVQSFVTFFLCHISQLVLQCLALLPPSSPFHYRCEAHNLRLFAANKRSFILMIAPTAKRRTSLIIQYV